jgi:hypothetical protein
MRRDEPAICQCPPITQQPGEAGSRSATAPERSIDTLARRAAAIQRHLLRAVSSIGVDRRRVDRSPAGEGTAAAPFVERPGGRQPPELLGATSSYRRGG